LLAEFDGGTMEKILIVFGILALLGLRKLMEGK